MKKTAFLAPILLFALLASRVIFAQSPIVDDVRAIMTAVVDGADAEPLLADLSSKYYPIPTPYVYKNDLQQLNNQEFRAPYDAVEQKRTNKEITVAQRDDQFDLIDQEMAGKLLVTTPGLIDDVRVFTSGIQFSIAVEGYGFAMLYCVNSYSDELNQFALSLSPNQPVLVTGIIDGYGMLKDVTITPR